MPNVAWPGVEDACEAAKVVGPRIQQLRRSRGLTLRDLSSRSGVSKNTILRLEHGLPITVQALERICNTLQTILPNLLGSVASPDQGLVRVTRADPRNWRIAFCRKKAPKKFSDFDLVDDPAERTRIGGLGFVSGFVQTTSSLEAGRLQASLVDLYGRQERAGFRHSGEEFVFCLSGRLLLTVGKESHILEEGDSAIFPSGVRHRYEAAGDSGSAPTRILMVWMESDEEEASVSHDEECDLFE